MNINYNISQVPLKQLVRNAAFIYQNTLYIPVSIGTIKVKKDENYIIALNVKTQELCSLYEGVMVSLVHAHVEVDGGYMDEEPD